MIIIAFHCFMIGINMNKKLIALLTTVSVLSFTVYAKHYDVKLLTTDDKGQNMVMSPGFLKISPGDTVTFIPADPSHNVESLSIPKKAKSFSSKMGKVFSHTFDENGVYLYKCTPHFALGMLGVIQVGAAENVAIVTKEWSEISSGVVMNKNRVSTYLSQVN